MACTLQKQCLGTAEVNSPAESEYFGQHWFVALLRLVGAGQPNNSGFAQCCLSTPLRPHGVLHAAGWLREISQGPMTCGPCRGQLCLHYVLLHDRVEGKLRELFAFDCAAPLWSLHLHLVTRLAKVRLPGTAVSDVT